MLGGSESLKVLGSISTNTDGPTVARLVGVLIRECVAVAKDKAMVGKQFLCFLQAMWNESPTIRVAIEEMARIGGLANLPPYPTEKSWEDALRECWKNLKALGDIEKRNHIIASIIRGVIEHKEQEAALRPPESPDPSSPTSTPPAPAPPDARSDL